MAVNVKTQDFEEQVAKASGPVLVDFWASWCGPCRMLAPVIDQLAAEQTDVKVCKVNIDEEPGLAQRFGVMSIPTVVFLKNGKEIEHERLYDPCDGCGRTDPRLCCNDKRYGGERKECPQHKPGGYGCLRTSHDSSCHDGR